MMKSSKAIQTFQVYDLPYVALLNIGEFLSTDETMALYVFSVQQKKRLESRLAKLKEMPDHYLKVSQTKGRQFNLPGMYDTWVENTDLQLNKAIYFQEVATELLNYLPPLTNENICAVMNQVACYNRSDLLVLITSKYWNRKMLESPHLSNYGYIKCIADYNSLTTVPGKKRFAQQALKIVGNVRQNPLLMHVLSETYVETIYDNPHQNLLQFYRIITEEPEIACSSSGSVIHYGRFAHCFENPLPLFKRVCADNRMTVPALIRVLNTSYHENVYIQNAYSRAYKPESKKKILDHLILAESALSIVFTNLIYRLTLSGLYYSLLREPDYHYNANRTYRAIIGLNSIARRRGHIIHKLEETLANAQALTPIYAPGH